LKTDPTPTLPSRGGSYFSLLVREGGFSPLLLGEGKGGVSEQ